MVDPQVPVQAQVSALVSSERHAPDIAHHQDSVAVHTPDADDPRAGSVNRSLQLNGLRFELGGLALAPQAGELRRVADDVDLADPAPVDREGDHARCAANLHQQAR